MRLFKGDLNDPKSSGTRVTRSPSITAKSKHGNKFSNRF